MPDLATYYYERNKLLTLLLAYERPTLLRLLPLYGFTWLVLNSVICGLTLAATVRWVWGLRK